MNLFQSRLLVSLIYMLLFALGVFLSIYLDIENSMLKLLIIDVVLTIVIFFQSTILRNASTYDLYWSVLPFYFLFYWIYELGLDSLNYRMILLIVLCSWWSWRLSLNWYRGWKGFVHEDWRYVNLRKKTGFFYPAVNFLGIHLMPTILVFMGSMPFEVIFSSDVALSWIDLAGCIVIILGVSFETVADNQMHQFKKNNRGRNIETGIWKYSRHPNYLGEMLFWWGVFLLGYSAGCETYYISGAVAMTILFVFISIPMMEKRLKEKYPEYEAYKKRTSVLIPFKIRQ